jgi:hypothetical protein
MSSGFDAKLVFWAGKMEMQRTELDDAIRESLWSFHSDISGGWCGREREAVSLFAFGHLSKHFGPGRALCSLAQIGIEVAVQQLKPSEQHPRRRGTVCKDLVIWPEPGMTLWDAVGNLKHEPLAVVEWKLNYAFGHRMHEKNRLDHRADVLWLKETAERVRDFAGYAVLIEGTLSPKRLTCARIQRGDVNSNWVVLPTTNDQRLTTTS